MESKKMILMNLVAQKEWKCRYRKWTCGQSGGRKEWDKWGREHQHIYTTMCKTDSY